MKAFNSKLSIYLYLNILLILLYISYFPQNSFAVEVGNQAVVKANIPVKLNVKVFGYTSPEATVQITGVRIYAQTKSDKTGYFEIKDVGISTQAQELCLISIDSDSRTTLPLCISTPLGGVEAIIGPLLLPPTLSLSDKQIWQKQKAFAQGKTIPNQTLKLSLFEVDSRNISALIIDKLASIFHPKALALDLPILNLTSDRNGNFNISLPTFKPVAYRIFAHTIFKDKPTIKSNTLAFLVESKISYFYRYTLPIFILVLLILIISTSTFAYEYRTKRISGLVMKLTEKRLKQLAIRTRLRFRRLWYNFREYLKSHRK